jgi:hypothetical protein
MFGDKGVSDVPQQIHSALKKFWAQSLNGNTGIIARPGTLYLGLRTDAPGAGDTLATVQEVSGGGYARAAIANTAGASPAVPDGASGNDWQLAIPATSFPQFTGAPSANGATHWFLCDAAAGTAGNLFASGPLNPATVTDTLQAASASATTTITITPAKAALLNPGDFLYVGTNSVTAGTGFTAGDEERVKVASINTGTGVVTLTAGLANAHASGEAVSRDGCTRNYTSGMTETVTATILLSSYPN